MHVGISSTDCDVAAIFVNDGKIVLAAQEERFTRIKQQSGFPTNAISAGLKHLCISTQDIKTVSYGRLDYRDEIK